MPTSLAKIYVGQRPRTGDLGAGSTGVGGNGCDPAILPGALSNALSGTLYTGALSSYLAITGGHAKRPGTSEYPRMQCSPRPPSSGRPATSSSHPASKGHTWSAGDPANTISEQRGVAEPGPFPGRLARIVPAEPLVLPVDGQARQVLQSRRFEPQSARSALLVATRAPLCAPLAPILPRTRALVRNEILRGAEVNEEDADEPGESLWSGDNDVLQVKQRTVLMRKRTRQLLQRAEEAELQYCEQFLLPHRMKSSSSTQPAPDVEKPAPPELPAAAGPESGLAPAAGRPLECEATQAVEPGIACPDQGQSQDQAGAAIADPVSPSKAKGSPRKKVSTRQSRVFTSTKNDIDAISSLESAAQCEATNEGAENGIAEKNRSDAKHSNQAAGPGNPVSSQDGHPATSPHALRRRGSKESLGSAPEKRASSHVLDKKEHTQIEKRGSIFFDVGDTNDVKDVKDSKDAKDAKNTKGTHKESISHHGSPPRSTRNRKSMHAHSHPHIGLFHSASVGQITATRSSEFKAFEVSRKMDYEGHSSVGLISMFVNRTSGDLRIQVFLMATHTSVELMVQAAHIGDLSQHINQFGQFGRSDGNRSLQRRSPEEGQEEMGHRRMSVVDSRRSLSNHSPKKHERHESPETANWERLSEMIQVDRRSKDDEDEPTSAGKVKPLTLQIMGWQHPDERKAEEQREVGLDFAEIFHRSQDQNSRMRFFATNSEKGRKSNPE